jgi:DeoR family suf operon transcriptional repressor
MPELFAERLPASLPGHKGLKGQILLELKRDQPLTAQELARRHGVTAAAVRRHLKELEAEQLVVYRRERRGKGAPVFVYRLSPAGEELFPRGYEEALKAALQFLERNGGREAVRRFFSERFAQVAESLKPKIAGATLRERLEAVTEVLSEQGFMAEWSVGEGVLRMAEHNCAVQAVAERYPEICEEERRFLREVLGAEVDRRQHIASGCNACEYVVEPHCAIEFAELKGRT